MPNTLTLIASASGTGSSTVLQFTSIPSTYTDLCLKLSARSTAADTNVAVGVTFNGSATSYSGRQINGNGTSAGSSTSGGSTFIEYLWMQGTSMTANTFSNSELYIPNYAGSSNKSVSLDSVTENNATFAYSSMAAGLWSNTAAINQITLTSTNGNFATYSTAYLYGISKS